MKAHLCCVLSVYAQTWICMEDKYSHVHFALACWLSSLSGACTTVPLMVNAPLIDFKSRSKMVIKALHKTKDKEIKTGMKASLEKQLHQLLCEGLYKLLVLYSPVYQWETE